MGQLQRLRDELDLANAAATEFHVEADLLLDLAIDLLFGKPNTRERSTHTHVRTKDGRRDGFLETREQFRRARRCTRTNECLAFPILRGVQVITLRFLQ